MNTGYRKLKVLKAYLRRNWRYGKADHLRNCWNKKWSLPSSEVNVLTVLLECQITRATNDLMNITRREMRRQLHLFEKKENTIQCGGNWLDQKKQH